MQTKSSTGTNTLLIALIVIFTFPLWIGLLGGIFGIIMGIFGAVIGVVAGLIGAVFGVIGGIFGWAFDWDFHWPFGFWNAKLFTVAAIVFLIILLTRTKR